MWYTYIGGRMYEYIKGNIVNQESNYIVLDNSGIGYLIYVSNPYYFELNKEYIIYVYQYVREDEITLYGFIICNIKHIYWRYNKHHVKY